MTAKLALLVSAAALVASCKTTAEIKSNDDIPRWAQRRSGACVEIPEFGVSAKNLCGIGVAENIRSYSLGIDTASAKARAAVAEVMETRIKAFLRQTQDDLNANGQSDSIQKVQGGVESVIKTTLAGVTVPAVYHDKAENRYFAVAMVDKDTFLKAFAGLQQSNALSEEVKAEINKRAADVEKAWDAADEKAGL